ncbi:hypothetical protein P7D22_02295 [Lichenihabitans sp. Uapishka_5]|uniref:COG4223 family protein n=1 Tax=Lichenihabitans sp. Uapishka_5 TaxID=3037302 RepID=UPI0029E7D8FC|nr:hypothetical protein [Lichenihabitans sp. Uapishka_5]MDX7950006.1 hypothetical protein [Lichenihabitans sp. Uapishka_5]
MADDEERRQGMARPNRRDPARSGRRSPPVIDGSAEDVTPAGEAMIPVSPEVEPSQDQSTPSPNEAVSPMPGDTIGTSETPPDSHAASHPFTTPDPDATAGASRFAASSSAMPAAPARSPLALLSTIGVLILAAGLVYLWSQLTSIPPDQSAAVADLRSRLAAVENRPVSDAGAVADRVAKLEAAATATQSIETALGKRLDGVASAIAAQSDVPGQVAALRSAAAGLKTGLADVQTSVAAIPRPDVSRIESRFGEVDTRLNALQGTVSAIPHVDLGPITAKVDGMTSRLTPLESELAAASAPDRIAQRKAAPLAVTAQAIGDAIKSGQPFPQELRALQALQADPARMTPLAAVAEAGAPTLRDLQTGLDDLRGRIVAQGATPQSGSYVDRLMAGASSLVQVRPLGSVVGDTPSAVVSRMRDAIASDDLGAALDDWKLLPAASQEASKSLADRIRSRLDAERAARDIATTAIGAMGSPKG